MKLRRLMAGLGTAAILAGGLLGVGTATASAAPAAANASCVGSACSGLDPVVTGCNVGATLMMSENAWGGTANLWWSQACQSNWIQYDVPNSSYEYNLALSGSSGYVDNFATRTAGWNWGNLVYSPGAARMCIGRAPLTGGAYQYECWSQ